MDKRAKILIAAAAAMGISTRALYAALEHTAVVFVEAPAFELEDYSSPTNNATPLTVFSASVETPGPAVGPAPSDGGAFYFLPTETSYALHPGYKPGCV